MKLFRRFLLVLAAVLLAVGVLVALFYTVEDWRGARAWKDCQRDLQARGETLDAAAFVPPMIPDDQNLAMAPLFVRLYGYQVDPATGLLTFPKPSAAKNDLRDEITNMPRGSWQQGKTDFPHSGGDWTSGHALDLAAWQRYYRERPDFPRADHPQTPAEDVLLALTRYAPILDELAQAAAERPLTRFPVNWTMTQPALIALPHYNALQCLTSTLRLRVVANLALGRNDAAMRDLGLAQRLINISAADPFLIAQLVSVTQFGLTTEPIWKGLKERRWSGAELQQIKTGLRGLDYLEGFQQSMRCERASFLIKTLNYFKANGGLGQALNLEGIVESMWEDGSVNRTPRFPGFVIDLAPAGWYDQNKAVGCRFLQDHEIDLVDVKAHRVWLAKDQESAEAARRMTVSPYNLLVKVAVPVYAEVLRKFASYQADVDHAVIACALEQFYLDHQAYPERLDELSPAYLDHVPVDVIDGAPSRYRRTPDGRYALWSIGWNSRDDGGQMAWQKDGLRRDNRQGDWVWQYQEISRPDADKGK